MQNFYHQIKREEKCLPEFLPDRVIETLKNSIDCVNNYEKSKSNKSNYGFIECFNEAKDEINKIMMSIDLTKNYCPENETEKSYEINLVTSQLKKFKIEIKNGLEVFKKDVRLINLNKTCDNVLDFSDLEFGNNKYENLDENVMGKTEQFFNKDVIQVFRASDKSKDSIDVPLSAVESTDESRENKKMSFFNAEPEEDKEDFMKFSFTKRSVRYGVDFTPPPSSTQHEKATSTSTDGMMSSSTTKDGGQEPVKDFPDERYLFVKNKNKHGHG